ncbi:MAG: sensor histidine kinase [Burkholderiaceae bacterium]|nr:sensor histidine kinase [Burkholderiaceae bacterium]
MLHEFLATHRDELIQRCRAKLALRVPNGACLQNWIPLCIDQLIHALEAELALAPAAEAAPEPVPESELDHFPPGVGMAAALHGKEMLHQGYAVTDVVHNYGDICQSVSDLAVESGTLILAREFRILNRFLDYAIAHAVTEFSYQRDFLEADQHASDASDRMAVFLEELRNLLGTASLAFAAAKSGGLSASGATGAILERSLLAISHLIDNVAPDRRPAQPNSDVLDVFPLAPFIDEVRATAEPVAQAMGCTLTVLTVEPTLALKGNRDLLYAALIGLLQNAFATTLPNTAVVLSARVAADRILLEIADHCGGLGSGGVNAMLSAVHGEHRNMLGMPVARRFVAAHQGILTVRDRPCKGCVVTVSLPRYAVPT